MGVGATSLTSILLCSVRLTSSRLTTNSDLLAGLRGWGMAGHPGIPPLLSYVPGIIPRRIDATGRPTEDRQPWFVLARALAVACGGRALGNVKVDDRPVLVPRLRGRRPSAAGSMSHAARRGCHPERLRVPHGRHACPDRADDRTGRDTPAWDHWSSSTRWARSCRRRRLGNPPYGRDYRIGSRLKRLADEHGATLLINHHDRKAASADFIDSVSGTNGLAGSADTVPLLTRARHETNGLLQVTGRDVREDEYAVQFNAWAIWQLDGETLDDA